MTRFTRRRILAAGCGLAASTTLSLSSFIAHRVRARVLVVGGGPGGVAAARAIKAKSPEARVLLVECDPTRLARPEESDIVSGRPEPLAYSRLAAEDIDIALDEIRSIDWQAGRAEGLSGRAFGFDRLVMAPGIAFCDEGITGYDRETAALCPHGWTGRAGVAALVADIRAMKDTGTVIIRIPPGRMRFPAGPYRRAGEIARYLAGAKPCGRVVILDEAAPYPAKAALLSMLAEAHDARIGYLSGDEFGAIERIEAETRTLIGTYRSFCGDVINFIPAQQAGRIARVSGLADKSGWCPNAAATGQSLKQTDAYLIGEDSAAGIAIAAQRIANALNCG